MSTLNFGNLNLGMEFQTKGVDKALQEFARFQASVTRIINANADLSRSTVNAFARQESAVRQAVGGVNKLQQAMREAGAPTAWVSAVTRNFQALTKAMTSGELNMVQFNRAMDGFQGKMQRMRTAVSSLAPALTDAEKRTALMSKVFRDLQSTGVLAFGALSGFGARLRAFSSLAKESSFAFAGMIAGSVALVAGLGYAIKATTDMDRKLQSINNSLQVATGNTYLAHREFERITEVSEKFGLNLMTTAEGFAGFAAAATQSGLSMVSVRNMFEGVAAAASTFDLSVEKTQGIFFALTEMMSKGKVSMEELSRQFAQKIPGGMAIAARAMQMTEKQLIALVSAGKLTSVELIEKLGPQLVKELGDNAVIASQDLESAFQKLSSQTDLLMMSFNKSFGITKKVQDSLDALSRTLKFVRNNMEGATKSLEVFVAILASVAALRAFGAAMAFLNAQMAATRVIAIANEVGFMASMMTRAAAGARGLAVALGLVGVAGGPVTMLIGILGRLALGAAAYYGVTKLMDDGSQKVGDQFDELIDKTREFAGGLQKLDREGANTAQIFAIEVARGLSQLSPVMASTQAHLAEVQTEYQKFGRASDKAELDTTAEKLRNQWKQWNDLQLVMKMVTSKLGAYGSQQKEQGGLDDQQMKHIRDLIAEYETLKTIRDTLAHGGSKEDVDLLFAMGEAAKLFNQNAPAPTAAELKKQLKEAGFAARITSSNIADIIKVVGQWREEVGKGADTPKVMASAWEETTKALGDFLEQVGDRSAIETFQHSIGRTQEIENFRDKLSAAGKVGKESDDAVASLTRTLEALDDATAAFNKDKGVKGKAFKFDFDAQRRAVKDWQTAALSDERKAHATSVDQWDQWAKDVGIIVDDSMKHIDYMQKQAFYAQAGEAAQAMGNFAEVTKAGLGEQNDLYKAFAIAQILISQSIAIAKALEEGGPWTGPLLAASVAAQMGAQIAAVQKGNGFASGGMVTGPQGRDVIPAFLTSGEFVLPRSAVAKLGPGFLESLRSGNAPKFAGGGYVGVPYNSGSGNMNVQIIDQRRGGAPIETSFDQGTLRILVRDAWRKDVRDGMTDSTLGANYQGLSRRGRNR